MDGSGTQSLDYATGTGGRSRWLAECAALLGDTLGLIFPPTCLACDALLRGRDNAMVCDRCWRSFAVLPRLRCTRCGHPTTGSNCRLCPQLSLMFEAGESYCWFEGERCQRAIYALKYQGWHRVGTTLGARMARSPHLRRPVGRGVLVPVPLARKKARERGYNQSEMLAIGLASVWGIPVAPKLLLRTRETETQTRLTPEQRLHNVAGAFQVVPDAGLPLGETEIFLVDDVLTTGATLNACADALAAAGASSIRFITFGRARDPGSRAPSEE